MLGLTGPDFNADWFTNIGNTIVGSLIVNIYFPLIMGAFWFLVRKHKRNLDKTGRYETEDLGEPTKSGTIYQYINKHAGPQYFMHFKYSSIMNVIYLTMMFGPAMPVLFPICFGTLLILYILEIYMLHYVFK